MRVPLVLLALALLAGAPSAQAQWIIPQYSVVLTVEPPEDAFTVERRELTIAGRIEFLGDPTSVTNIHGIPVEYKITEMPAWLSGVVSPAADVIHLTFAGTHMTGSRLFEITLHLAEEPEESVVGTLEIVATVHPAAPASSKSLSVTIPIQFYAGEGARDEEECEHEHPAPAAFQYGTFAEDEAAPQESPAPEEDDLTVQSNGATRIGTWYAVGGFGLAGAALGFALWRRRSL